MNSSTNAEGFIIGNAAEHIRCDAACKKVLSIKQINGRILKTVADEFKDIDEEEIIKCIGNIETGTSPVHADTTPLIATDDSEDTTETEGTVRYDVKYTARVPGSEGNISVIINIEAQNSFNPGYSLLKRGIYYCCRLISSQYNRVFSNSEYDKLRKVYSIWICTSPDKKHRNTIMKYSMLPTALLGNSEELDSTDKPNYDMLDLIMICLDDNTYTKNNVSISKEQYLVNMLSALFASGMNAAEKQKILSDDYNLKLTKENSKEVEEMCNLSYKFLSDGVNIGIAKGIAEGIAEGTSREKLEGAVEYIKLLTSTCSSKDKFIEILSSSRYTSEECKKVFEKYPELKPEWLDL